MKKENKISFNISEKDFWNDLPGHVKAGIIRAKQQIAKGLLTPNDEVMRKYSKYLIK